MTRRGWLLSACAWLLLCLVQAPPLTVADTKHDLTANPWGFLHQALSPWTDIFPLGQLQNQAYGYLFPQGLFFALLSPLPNWLTQRLWWALLLTLAFAGVVKLLEATGTGSRGSRIIAGALYALSPRILTTLGAISSEAWPVAVAPWILLPVVRILATGSGSGNGAAGSAGPTSLASPSRWMVARAACSSAIAILCLGAVNAVATVAAVIPALVWWFIAGVCAPARTQRRTAWRFLGWWAPAGVLACFWWIGPLVILGRYSPPFTDYIESAQVTTHWFNLGEVLRGTTHWTAYLSSERQAGAALVNQPVFVAGTLIVAVLGLRGLAVANCRLPFRRVWVVMLVLGLLIFGVAGPFSPIHDATRVFLDQAGAPLRNLHKFDTLVRLPLMVGVAHLLAPVRLPKRSEWIHPERHRSVVTATSLGLVLIIVTAPAWSGRLVPVDGYRAVPGYWAEAAAWLNDPAHGAQNTRTMILPRAASARQSWGNTRDEPAQALLNVPWVVRDAVPLVPPEAIRGLDGVQREFDTGAPAPALAQALLQQGVGYLLVRSDLTSAASTPGSRSVLRTLRNSPGFTEVASFGDGSQSGDDSGGAVRIFQVGQNPGTTAIGARTVHLDELDLVAGGAEVLPRIAAADTTGSDTAQTPPLRDRLLIGDPGVPSLPDTPITVTDTPALREHDYGSVISPDSAIRAPGDPWRGINPVHDYPAPGTLTKVRESHGRIIASSAADDSTSLGGSDTLSSVSAAVDGDPLTAWYPASGSPVNQSLSVILDSPVHQLRLTAQAQGTPLRVQVTTYRAGQTVASSTVEIPEGRMKTFSLPPGEADRVELRIIGAWGPAGISEFRLTQPDGTDVTPRREILVPVPEGTIGRWVLGQEIPEGTLRRIITVPAGGMRVRMNISDCTSTTSVDGTVAHCDQVLPLAEGEHEVRSTARWVELVNTEVEAGQSTNDQGSDTRIVVTPTTVNSGRVAHLRTAGMTIELAPVTVNGWQQGWLVPASLGPTVAAVSDTDLAAAVTVDFPATSTYRAWLAAGLGSAVVLVLVWLLLLWPGWWGTAGLRGRDVAAPAQRGTLPRDTPAPAPAPSRTQSELRRRSELADPSGSATSPRRRRRRRPHFRSLVPRLLALTAWCGVATILAGVSGAVTAALTAGVLLLGAVLRAAFSSSGDQPTAWRRALSRVLSWVRPVPTIVLTGGFATIVFTRGPWGSRGIADGYAGDSPVVQLVLVVCITAVLTAVVAPAAPAPPVRRPDHQRDTARRAGSSTTA